MEWIVVMPMPNGPDNKMPYVYGPFKSKSEAEAFRALTFDRYIAAVTTLIPV